MREDRLAHAGVLVLVGGDVSLTRTRTTSSAEGKKVVPHDDGNHDWEAEAQDHEQLDRCGPERESGRDRKSRKQDLINGFNLKVMKFTDVIDNEGIDPKRR